MDQGIRRALFQRTHQHGRPHRGGRRDGAHNGRRYGDQSFKPGEKDSLGDEMADVLWVLLCIANQTGIDLTEELHRNIEKKTARDKDRHINNKKLRGE